MQKKIQIFDQTTQQVIDSLCQKYGVANLWLFGSHARGDHSEQSDYDFLYIMDHKNYALDLFNFADEIETLLGRAVDVVAYKYVKPHFKENVDNEMVTIYEAA